jgi:hypothetical protein
MTNINLLFTCPHDGRKKGSQVNPPIIKRNTDNFPAENCPAADGLRSFYVINLLTIKYKMILLNDWNNFLGF